MKPGRITGALGGLFGMIGSIATAAKPDPIIRRGKYLRRRLQRRARLLAKAGGTTNKGKRALWLAQARAIVAELESAGFELQPGDLDE